MRHVNLLPADAYAPRRWWAAEQGGTETTKRVLALGGAVAALLAVVLGGLYVHAKSVVNDRQDTLAALNVQVATAEAEAAKVRAEQADAQARLAAVTSVASQRMAWDVVMRQLAQYLPSNALLSSLSASAPAAGAAAPATAAGTAPPAGGAFSVAGTTTSHRGVALVLDRLELLPWLSGVTLGSSTVGTGDAGSGASFSATGTVTSTGAQP